MPALLEERRGRLDGSRYHRGEIERRLGERDRATGKAGHVQQVVHEAREVLDLPNDGLDILTPLSVDATLEKTSRREDRGQRVAQLVREQGEEVVLSSIRAAQRFLVRAFVGNVRRRVDHARHAVDLATNAGQHDPNWASVFRMDCDLETPVGRVLQRCDELRALFRRPEPELDGRLADGFLTSESGELDERIVDQEVSSVGLARDGQGLRSQVEDGLEPPFRRSQRVLGRAPVVDVERHRDPSNDVASRISDSAKCFRDASDTRRACLVSDIRTPSASTFRVHVPSGAQLRLDHRGVRRRAPLCR